MSSPELSPEMKERLFPEDVVARQLEIVDVVTRLDNIKTLLKDDKYSHLAWHASADAIDPVEELYERGSRKISKTGRELIKHTGWIIGGVEENRYLTEEQRMGARLAFYFEYFEDLKKYQAVKYAVRLILSQIKLTEQKPNGNNKNPHAHAA